MSRPSPNDTRLVTLELVFAIGLTSFAPLRGELAGKAGTPVPGAVELACAQRPLGVVDDVTLRREDAVPVTAEPPGDARRRATCHPSARAGVEYRGAGRSGGLAQAGQPVPEA